MIVLFFFCFKQKTAYEMRISDWSSDVCSSDLLPRLRVEAFERVVAFDTAPLRGATPPVQRRLPGLRARLRGAWRGAAQGIAPGVPVLACQGLHACPGACYGNARPRSSTLPAVALPVPPGSRPDTNNAPLPVPRHHGSGMRGAVRRTLVPPITERTNKGRT